MGRELLILALVLAGSPAAAQLPEKALLADTNGDGRVSPAEYATSRKTFIMRADANKDGKVSAAEWKSAASRMASTLDTADGHVLTSNQANGFAWIDANKDGYITGEEIDAWTTTRFPKLDLNKDGFVSKGEARQIEIAAGKKAEPTWEGSALWRGPSTFGTSVSASAGVCGCSASSGAVSPNALAANDQPLRQGRWPANPSPTIRSAGSTPRPR